MSAEPAFRIHFTDTSGSPGTTIVRAPTPEAARKAFSRMSANAGFIVTKTKLVRDGAHG